MDAFLERYDSYCAERERALWRLQTDPDARPRLLELDGEFDDVTSGDALSALRQEHERSGSAELRTELARLIHHVEGAALEARVRPLELELRAARRSPASPGRVAALREQRWAELGAWRAKLGHARGIDRVRARLPGVDLEHWLAAAAAFLAATQSAHADARALALARAERGPGDCSRAAHVAVRRLERFGPLFPPERLRSYLEFACEPLAPSLARLRWSEAPRARTRCWPIRIPGEITVALSPRGGAPACAQLFAAAGQALAHAQTHPDLPVSLRRPWDPALPQAWSALARRRLADARWLEDLPTGPHAEDLASALPFAELARLRAAAGRLAFEWSLAEQSPDSDPRRLSAQYASLLLEATGFEHPEDYLAPLQGLGDLPALDTLRAECLAAQLESALRSRFGRKHWRLPRSAALLRELWYEGSRYTAEELAQALDLGPLDLTRLAWG